MSTFICGYWKIKNNVKYSYKIYKIANGWNILIN